jgi:hypothetical protein
MKVLVKMGLDRSTAEQIALPLGALALVIVVRTVSRRLSAPGALRTASESRNSAKSSK